MAVEGHQLERHTRVVCSTFPNRGKSFTPESRIEMLEEMRALVERRDDTQEARGFAIARISPAAKGVEQKLLF